MQQQRPKKHSAETLPVAHVKQDQQPVLSTEDAKEVGQKLMMTHQQIVFQQIATHRDGSKAEPHQKTSQRKFLSQMIGQHQKLET